MSAVIYSYLVKIFLEVTIEAKNITKAKRLGHKSRHHTCAGQEDEFLKRPQFVAVRWGEMAQAKKPTMQSACTLIGQLSRQTPNLQTQAG